ncbi:MAG: aminotransferase class I/II-fold pyridoxal phosphate-dependent enzyme [Bacteroidaceae bacterium]|nr:aminotransferase class I/II-fold pyridoxal phosphate-dependent enzyme [Bacteroidaceae bacterium]
MQAIILAAGMGKRLGEYTYDNTKCMLEVNGIRLIDRALACLNDIKVSRVILVVGYKGQKVKDYVGNDYKGTPIVYVDNPVYDKTNNIYSLFLAKDYMLEEDTILLESDLIYEPAVVSKLLDDDFPNIALVDKYESWMDGTVVTMDEENRITRFIDKDQFKFEEIKSYYKTVNIYKFSKEFSAKYYVPFLAAYSTALGNNEYYEQVLRVILHLPDAPLKALPLTGETWYEIDDVQDLDIASAMFAPSDDEHFKAISSRYGGYWRYPQMLDFCYLVNPYFPPQRMIDEIKASFETLMREYPSGMRVNSLLASKNFGVKEEYILVGNGAAELIKAYMENWAGRTGIILPTFEEYPNRKDCDSVVQYVPEADGFKYTAEDIKRHFADKEIDSLLLINPDNPSGNYIPFAEVMGLIEWTKEQGLQFIVDESFVDFAQVEGQFSLFDNGILAANPHLTVVKSISKSYGVPGLRLGVLASGNTEVIAKLKKQVAIWNINSFGEFYMQIYEKYHKDYDKACELFRAERALFKAELDEVPFLKVYDSQANYFLCRVTERFTSHELALTLLKHNILIKDCGAKKAFNGGKYIRLAVRNREDNHYLTETLKSI